MPRGAGSGGPAGQFGPEVYAAWRNSSLGEITEALEYRLIFALAGPVAGRTVLDVGCGDGTLAAAFARAGASRVAGCDVDARMLARARARATPDLPSLQLAVASGLALPFADHSFDIVTCITVLAFVAQPDLAIREMARVLRPGGCLIIGDLNRWSVWAVRRRIRGLLGAPLWRAARFRSAGALAALVRQAGLRPQAVRGAIFFPPWTWAARLMAPVDAWFGARTTVGAAFVAVLSHAALAAEQKGAVSPRRSPAR